MLHIVKYILSEEVKLNPQAENQFYWFGDNRRVQIECENSDETVVSVSYHEPLVNVSLYNINNLLITIPNRDADFLKKMETIGFKKEWDQSTRLKLSVDQAFVLNFKQELEIEKDIDLSHIKYKNILQSRDLQGNLIFDYKNTDNAHQAITKLYQGWANEVARVHKSKQSQEQAHHMIDEPTPLQSHPHYPPIIEKKTRSQDSNRCCVVIIFLIGVLIVLIYATFSFISCEEYIEYPDQESSYEVDSDAHSEKAIELFD